MPTSKKPAKKPAAKKPAGKAPAKKQKKSKLKMLSVCVWYIAFADRIYFISFHSPLNINKSSFSVK